MPVGNFLSPFTLTLIWLLGECQWSRAAHMFQHQLRWD